MSNTESLRYNHLSPLVTKLSDLVIQFHEGQIGRMQGSTWTHAWIQATSFSLWATCWMGTIGSQGNFCMHSPEIEHHFTKNRGRGNLSHHQVLWSLSPLSKRIQILNRGCCEQCLLHTSCFIWRPAQKRGKKGMEQKGSS